MTLTFMHSGTSCVLCCMDPDLARGHHCGPRRVHRPTQALIPVSGVMHPNTSPSPVAPVGLVPALPSCLPQALLTGPQNLTASALVPAPSRAQGQV